MTTLYIDADACPVKREAEEVSGRFGVPMVLVSAGGVRPNPDPRIRSVIVPEGPDAADDWIAERIGPGDVCVTNDIPLAARCLAAGAAALRPDGEAFTETNIGARLASRDLMADLRAADPFMTAGGGRAFSKADRSRFRDHLDRVLRRAAAR